MAVYTKYSRKRRNTMSFTVTAKTAISHIQGVRTMLRGQLRTAKQLGADTTQLEKKLANMEYVEATLVAQRASGKSGLKAGLSAGFVPYADR